MKKLNFFQRNFYLGLILLVISAVLIYLITRIYLVSTSSLYWYEWIITITLLLAEVFILLHTIGYFLNIYRVVKYNSSFKPIIEKPNLKRFPHVAIAVAPCCPFPSQIYSKKIAC